MRGYIYEVTSEINNIGFMNESDFYSLVGVEADYFVDAEYEDDNVKDYLEGWKKYGAETGIEKNDDGEEIPWIIFNRNARRFCQGNNLPHASPLFYWRHIKLINRYASLNCFQYSISAKNQLAVIFLCPIRHAF